MHRRALLLAAAVLGAAPLVQAPAHAGPPYCVSASDRGGTIAYVCAFGKDCWAYGGTYDTSWCAHWL